MGGGGARLENNQKAFAFLLCREGLWQQRSKFPSPSPRAGEPPRLPLGWGREKPGQGRCRMGVIPRRGAVRPRIPPRRHPNCRRARPPSLRGDGEHETGATNTDGMRHNG